MIVKRSCTTIRSEQSVCETQTIKSSAYACSNSEHKQSRLYKHKKALIDTVERDSISFSSFDSAARQIKLINHSFEKNSVKFEIKSQITLQVNLQSCSVVVHLHWDWEQSLERPFQAFSCKRLKKRAGDEWGLTPGSRSQLIALVVRSLFRSSSLAESLEQATVR